jgi:hypothetical protein
MTDYAPGPGQPNEYGPTEGGGPGPPPAAHPYAPSAGYVPGGYPPGSGPGVYGPPTDAPVTRRLDAGRLWAGGIAAAAVAAGVAIVGYLFVRGVLGIPILGAKLSGVAVLPSLGAYAAVAFLAGIAATGLMHLLLLTTPRPSAFFGWLMALATVTAMLIPLALDESIASRLATAMINILIGIAIGTLVYMSAQASIRRVARG